MSSSLASCELRRSYPIFSSNFATEMSKSLLLSSINSSCILVKLPRDEFQFSDLSFVRFEYFWCSFNILSLTAVPLTIYIVFKSSFVPHIYDSRCNTSLGLIGTGTILANQISCIIQLGAGNKNLSRSIFCTPKIDTECFNIFRYIYSSSLFIVFVIILANECCFL